MLLQTQLCSTEAVDRKFAVDKIRDLSDQAEERDTQADMVNKLATCLRDLIIWKEDEMSSQSSLWSFLEKTSTPMVVPKPPVHGQSIERFVWK